MEDFTTFTLGVQPDTYNPADDPEQEDNGREYDKYDFIDC